MNLRVIERPLPPSNSWLGMKLHSATLLHALWDCHGRHNSSILNEGIESSLLDLQMAKIEEWEIILSLRFQADLWCWCLNRILFYFLKQNFKMSFMSYMISIEMQMLSKFALMDSTQIVNKIFFSFWILLLDHIWSGLLVFACDILRTNRIGENDIRRMTRKMRYLEMMVYEGQWVNWVCVVWRRES